MLHTLHFYLSFISVLLLIISVGTFKWGWFFSKSFSDKHLRLALFTLIIYHIQLTIGLILFALARIKGPKNEAIHPSELYHPWLMIAAIALITIGFSKHKNKYEDKSKFWTLLWYYGIALLIVLFWISWRYYFTL